MDSSDLSLIEIAGEDDSLLQQISGDDGGVSSHSANRNYGAGDYFMCSPLQVPRSNSKPIGGMVMNEGSEDTKHTLYKDGVNKENFNVEKAETLKLSIEPQQMKRKKKGGGYNLRKSLAWDRAFFTEEGVLDSAELSMISGKFSKSRGETLSAIQEEDTDCTSTSLDLQALEENLFKKLPTTPSGKGCNGGSLLPKKQNNEIPNSVATRKVLTTHDVNRSGSKHNGCPRPLATSSLKRPANLVTTTSSKGSKVSKVPVQKTNPSASSRISKSSTQSASDSKPITRPAVNVQKTTGLRGSSSNTKNIVNSSKAGPPGRSLTTKTSLGQAKRTESSSVKCSLTKAQLPLNADANSDLKVISNLLFPPAQFALNVHDDISSKIAIPLPRTACQSGVSMQDTQLQTAKPSGLRMPSPSLRFFGQPKAPPLQNPLKRTSQTSNLPESDMSNLTKVGVSKPVFERRPPLAPRSLPGVGKEGATIGTIKASCLSSRSVPSSINPALNEAVELDSQLSNLQKIEQKVQYNNNMSEVIKSKKELHGTFVSVDPQIFGRTGQCTSKPTSQMEDVTEHRNDDNFLQTETLQQVDKYDTDVKFVDGSAMNTRGSELEIPDLTSHSSSQLEVTAFSANNDIIDHLLVEDKPPCLSIEDHVVSSEINVGKCNVSETLGGQADMMYALSCVVGPISSSQMLQDNVANSEVQDYNVSEIEEPDASFHLRSTEQLNSDTIALDKVVAQSNFEDADVQSLGGNTTVKSSKSYISTSINNQQEADVSNVIEKPEYPEFQNSLRRENALQDGVMLGVDDSLLGQRSFLPEESKLESNFQSDEPEGIDSCESELKRSSTPRLIQVAMQGCGSDMAKLVERQNQEDVLTVAVDSKPAVENFNLDAHFQFNAGLHGHPTSMELENTDEDHLTDAVSVGDVNVACERSRHFGEIEREVPYTTHEQSRILQVEGDFWKNHTVEHDDAEDKKIKLSMESSCCSTNSQPEDKFSTDCDYASLRQIYVLRGENNVSNQTGDQDKQVSSCFPEGDRISHEEKQSPESHCLPFEHNHSLEEPQKSKDGNKSDVTLEVRIHDGSELESPGLSLQHTNQALDESEVINCMIEEPDGNSELQDPVIRIEEVFPAGVTIVGLNHVSLADNTAEESNEDECEIVLKECNEAPIVQIDGLDVEKDVESLEVKAAVTSSLGIAPSAENVQCVTKCGHENELSSEASSPKSCLDPNVSNNQNYVNRTLDIEQQHELENTLPTEDEDVKKEHEKSGLEKKQDILIKPPPYATPFSDEWLAAFEAAGEEVLTMKSGAVQNSPQERSQPEPGPWSPVKRKHSQAIGPFDCTKYTNTNQ